MGKKSEEGSFTIEATMALTIFMFAIAAIVSLAQVVRVECTTQYAIDQVAKEISQYYYLPSKLGLYKDTDTSVIDDAVGAVVDLASIGQKTAGDIKTSTASKDLSQILENADVLKDDVKSVQEASKKVEQTFGTALEDPKVVLSSLATVIFKKGANELITKVIAQPLCKVLTKQYITSRKDVDGTLKKWGVVDGLDGLDFSLSEFCNDQKSINVVVVYRIKVQGYGILDKTLNVRQSACTEAWIEGKK